MENEYPVDAEFYNVTIRKTVIDSIDHYEARIMELPDIVEYAPTPLQAYDLALDSIRTTAAYFAEKGRQMPSPLVP